MRYFFEIAYNGKNYNGWQTQQNGVAVQAVVENALSKFFREEVTIQCSGRTDTGVHCEQQFFHVDISADFDRDSTLQKLNAFLPKDIALRGIRAVKPDANARYDAIERTYRYQITLIKNPFAEGLSWHYFKEANVPLMNEAALLLLGEQDFECFSKVKTNVNHFLCHIKKAEWTSHGNELVFMITANRFLRGMVRAIVGTLLNVGGGKISVDDFQKIIKSRDRKMAGANVPAHALYLMSVKYPSAIFID
jgi:tRNA pseudouridine38-40 synthase